MELSGRLVRNKLRVKKGELKNEKNIVLLYCGVGCI